MALARDPLRLQPARRDRGDERRRDGEGDGVDPVREVRPGRRDDDAADQRRDRPGQVLDRLEQRVRLRRDPPRRRGSAGRRRRRAGRSRCRSRRRRRARRSARARGRTAARRRPRAAARSAPIIRPRRASRSSSGPSSEPDHDRGQELRDQEGRDPGARARPFLDVDLERDEREPGARPGAERRDEEAAERGRATQQRRLGSKRETHPRRTVTPAAARDERPLSAVSGGDAGYAAAPETTRPSAASRNACSSAVPTLTRIASGSAEAVQRPHDHALAQQAARTAASRPRRGRRRRSSRPPGRPARGRGRGGSARARAGGRRSRSRRRASSPGASRLASAAACAGVVRSNARRVLPIAVTSSAGADGVADAQAREPVDLRERPQDDRAAALLHVLLDPVRVVRVVDVLGVGLVEHREHVRREPGRTTRRPRRACSSCRSGCSGGRGRRASSAARSRRASRRGRSGARGAAPCAATAPILARVDRVARERRPAADDLVAGLERRLRDRVDEAVRARAERDLLEADAVALGERGAQRVGAAVRVAVELRDRPLDRRARPRETGRTGPRSRPA